MGVNLSSVEHPGYDRLAPSTVREMTTPWEIPEPEDVACPGCGNYYHTEGLGLHWVSSPRCRPSLTDRQRELVVGLLMSDGCLARGGKNPRLVANMTSPRYLQHLDQEFGVLSTGVRLHQTATELARKNRETGFSQGALAEDYQDQYVWQTRNLPELHDYDWYSGGKKVWPSDLDLTPTVLRTLFVCDGHWSHQEANNRISISMSNESDHKDKVDAYFERVNLPTPSNYSTSERGDGSTKCDAVFSQNSSRELLEYMGSPPPGFEYKWPEEYTNPTLRDLKQRLRSERDEWRGPLAAVSIEDDDLSRLPLEPRVNVDGTDKVTFHRQELTEWLS